jgi:hypothetical protein
LDHPRRAQAKSADQIVNEILASTEQIRPDSDDVPCRRTMSALPGMWTFAAATRVPVQRRLLDEDGALENDRPHLHRDFARVQLRQTPQLCPGISLMPRRASSARAAVVATSTGLGQAHCGYAGL